MRQKIYRQMINKYETRETIYSQLLMAGDNPQKTVIVPNGATLRHIVVFS